MYYFNESDDYFIIFENDKKKEELRGRLAFIISASTYDTSKAAGYFDGNFRFSSISNENNTFLEWILHLESHTSLC